MIAVANEALKRAGTVKELAIDALDEESFWDWVESDPAVSERFRARFAIFHNGISLQEYVESNRAKEDLFQNLARDLGYLGCIPAPTLAPTPSPSRLRNQP